jgi:hypothetical protein
MRIFVIFYLKIRYLTRYVGTGSILKTLQFFICILRGLDWKLKQTIEENLTASYVRYGKKWRPMKRKAGGEDEQIEQDGVFMNLGFIDIKMSFRRSSPRSERR